MRDDAVWLSATEVVAGVAAGRLEPTAAVRAHLARIDLIDPAVRDFVHVDPDAAPGDGALSGVTLAVKDTQSVDGMPWTWGSPKWRDRVAGEDAIPVRRAREAGAAILGKTNLPELAAAVGTDNELFGPTHNPWRAGWTPGGSSGGSAAAVAAGLCTIAFGDDMGGSIRIPSSCCGVTGLRPSPGVVPTEIPDPTGLSVRGPLARSVADLRLALAVMTGRAEPPPAGPPGRLRVAVVRESPVPVQPACAAARERAARALEAAGHLLQAVPWDPVPVARAYQVVRPASVSIMPGEPEEYGAAAGRLIALGRTIPARDYLAALGDGVAAAARLHALLQDHDAILTPTLGRLPMPIAAVPPFLHDAWSEYTQFVLPVSFAGLPAVSLPAGVHEGLPVGVQLVGRPREEWALLDLAARLEAADGLGFRRPPSSPGGPP